jgi:hypothetical protein
MRIDEENLAEAISTATNLRRQIAATAASIAETEERLADTLDRLARSRPRDAERLRETGGACPPLRRPRARPGRDLPVRRS